MLLLLACVPTPDEDPVISKVDESGVSVQALDPDVLPNEFRHTFTENRVVIDVSAKVEKPDGKKLPSYALSPGAFSEEQVFAFVKALFGDSPIYEPGEPTKAEIYPQLLAALEELEKVKADPGAYEGGTAEYQRAVDELQQAYNTAPDSDSLKPKAMTLAASDIDHTAVFGCCGDCGKPARATLFVQTLTSPDSPERAYLRFTNSSRYIGISAANKLYPELILPEPMVSADGAIETAMRLAEQFGAVDYTFVAIEPGARIDDSTGLYEADPAETPYLVYFTRCMNGVQVTFDATPSAGGQFGSSYAEEMPYERLTVGVDSQGVCFVQWNGLCAVQTCLDEDCEIISLEQAAEQAAKYLSFLYPASDALNDANAEGHAQSLAETRRGSVRTSTVHIDRIVLGWMQVRNGASARDSKLIPVWDFFGTIERTYENGETVVTEGGLYSLLTLDAATGARIDRENGY
jgi:hypothetical protein